MYELIEVALSNLVSAVGNAQGWRSRPVGGYSSFRADSHAGPYTGEGLPHGTFVLIEYSFIFGQVAVRGLRVESLRGIVQIDIYRDKKAPHDVPSIYACADVFIRNIPKGMLVELHPSLITGGPGCLRITKTGYLSPVREEGKWHVLSVSIPFETLLSEEALLSISQLK